MLTTHVNMWKIKQNTLFKALSLKTQIHTCNDIYNVFLTLFLKKKINYCSYCFELTSHWVKQRSCKITRIFFLLLKAVFKCIVKLFNLSNYNRWVLLRLNLYEKYKEKYKENFKKPICEVCYFSGMLATVCLYPNDRQKKPFIFFFSQESETLLQKYRVKCFS